MANRQPPIHAELSREEREQLLAYYLPRAENHRLDIDAYEQRGPVAGSLVKRRTVAQGFHAGAVLGHAALWGLSVMTPPGALLLVTTVSTILCGFFYLGIIGASRGELALLLSEGLAERALKGKPLDTGIFKSENTVGLMARGLSVGLCFNLPLLLPMGTFFGLRALARFATAKEGPAGRFMRDIGRMLPARTSHAAPGVKLNLPSPAAPGVKLDLPQAEKPIIKGAATTTVVLMPPKPQQAATRNPAP